MISSTSQLHGLPESIEECVQIKEHTDNKVAINSQDYILLDFIFSNACLCLNFLLEFTQLCCYVTISGQLVTSYVSKTNTIRKYVT